MCGSFEAAEACRMVLFCVYALDHNVGLLVDGHFCWWMNLLWFGVVGKEKKKRNSNEDAVDEPVPGAAHGLACQRVRPCPRCPLHLGPSVGLYSGRSARVQQPANVGGRVTLYRRICFRPWRQIEQLC